MQDFEKTFSDFIDGLEYDKAENDFFSMMRASYLAGWVAAGGNPPSQKRAVEWMHTLMMTGHPSEK